MGDQSLHVLLLSGRFEVRGACAYTLRLAEHLPEYRIAPQVVTPDCSLIDPDRRAHLPIQEYANLDVPIWGRFVIQMLVNDLAHTPPDLLHVQSRKMIPIANLVADRLGRSYVLTVHDFLQPRERLAVRPSTCRRIIAVSESVKADLISRTSYPADLITVIRSGVEARGGEQHGSVLDPDRVPVIGTAGPLEVAKGFPFFLGAVPKVLAVHPKAKFIVAGGGPEEHNLRRLARKLGIEAAVTFVPNLHDFSKSLAAMDIFCLPSLQQGLGTIMLEAMSRGIPVIATRVGGVHSVVRDRETGLLAPPSDSTALADRINELLADRELARKIGAAACKSVRSEFAADTMVRLTAKLYREVVAEMKPTSTKKLAAAAT